MANNDSIAPAHVPPECELMKLKCVQAEGERVFDRTDTIRLPHKARRIKEIRAQFISVECDVGTDEIVVTGTVHKQIFFVRKDNNRLCHVAEDVTVGTVIPAPGARPGQQCQVQAKVLRVVPELEDDGRRLRQTLVLRAMAKAFEFCQLEVVIDPKGKLIKALRVVAEDTVSEVVEHIEDIAAIKLRQVEVSHGHVECLIERDQVRVSTIITKEICFVDSGNREVCEEFEIPFERIVSLPGVRPGMECQAEVRLGEPDTRLVFPPGSPVSTEAVNRIPVTVFAKVSELVQVRVAEDPEGPLVKVDVVRAENTKQILVEKVVFLKPPAKKIFDIEARLRDVKCVLIPNKAIVQGTIHKQVFFVGPDDCVWHRPEDVPFSTIVELPGAEPDMECQVSVEVEHIEPELLKKKRKKRRKPKVLGEHDAMEMAAEEAEDSADDLDAYGDDDEDDYDVDLHHLVDEVDLDHRDGDFKKKKLFKFLLQKVVLRILVKVTEEEQFKIKLCPDD